MTLTENCTTTQTITVPNGDTLNGASHTITAIGTSALPFPGPVVTNAGTTTTIEHLKITGDFTNTACASEADYLRGIEIVSGSATVTGVDISNINQGAANACNGGNGIVINDQTGGPYRATITSNKITNFQSDGIYVDGDVDATIESNKASVFGSSASAGGCFGIFTGVTPEVTISSNTIKGRCPQADGSQGIRVDDDGGSGPFAATVEGNRISKNEFDGIEIDGIVNDTVENNTIKDDSGSLDQCSGIDIWDNNQGTVSDNTVTAKCSLGRYSYGVTVNESDNVSVSDNHLTSSPGEGIRVQSSCGSLPDANDNHVTNNTIKATTGINIATFGSASSTCAAEVNDNVVTSNTLKHTGPGNTDGVALGANCSGDPFTCQVADNTIENNTITGYATPIADGGTGTVISGNTTN